MQAKVTKEIKQDLRHSIADGWLDITEFLIILASRKYATNEFHIFETFEIENIGQGQGEEKQDLPRSITNVCMCIT